MPTPSATDERLERIRARLLRRAQVGDPTLAAASITRDGRISASDYDSESILDVIRDLSAKYGPEDVAAEAEAIASGASDEAARHQALTEYADGLADGAMQGNALIGDWRILAARRAGAREAGLRIPTKDPFYVADDNTAVVNSIVRDTLEMGGRAFGYLGDPGTGKNSHVREIAAELGMPILEIDMSSTDDLNSLLYQTGIRDGDTIVEEGPLMRAARIPGGSVIVLNEVVEVGRDQLTGLHELFGSGSNDKGALRYLTIKSPSGENTQVAIDPDTLFFVTYNPDGHEDRRLHQALASRLTNISFEYGDAESEAERMTSMVYAAVGESLGHQADPTMTKPDAETGEQVPVSVAEQCPKLRDEVLKDVRFFRELRSAYSNPGDVAIKQFPCARQMAKFTATRLLEERNGYPDGALVAAQMLDFMLDQGHPREDRWRYLTDLMADHYPEALESTPGA